MKRHSPMHFQVIIIFIVIEIHIRFAIIIVVIKWLLGMLQRLFFLFISKACSSSKCKVTSMSNFDSKVRMIQAINQSWFVRTIQGSMTKIIAIPSEWRWLMIMMRMVVSLIINNRWFIVCNWFEREKNMGNFFINNGLMWRFRPLQWLSMEFIHTTADDGMERRDKTSVWVNLLGGKLSTVMTSLSTVKSLLPSRHTWWCDFPTSFLINLSLFYHHFHKHMQSSVFIAIIIASHERGYVNPQHPFSIFSTLIFHKQKSK